MRLGAIVLDSNDSEMLSEFYQKLLGWNKKRYDEEWIFVYEEDPDQSKLVFQEVEGYVRPVWPRKEGEQQQMIHLDFYADDVEEAVSHAISCGAALSDAQLDDGWKVLLDPAGHPICILPII